MRLGFAPRFAGLWVVRASIPAPRANGAQTHVDPFHREVPEPQERRTQEGERQIECDISAQDTSAAANAKKPLKVDEPKVARVTKQERVLTMLSQPEGASNASFAAEVQTNSEAATRLRRLS
jgi:hypothetical protein